MTNKLNALGTGQVKLLKKLLKQHISFLEKSFPSGHMPVEFGEEDENARYLLQQLKGMK